MLRFRMAGDIKPDLDKQWVVDDIVPAGGLSTLIAPPSSGKTFAAIHMGMCIARGEPWYGRRVMQGAVLYVCPDGEISGRAAAYFKHYGLDPSKIPFVEILEKAVDFKNPKAHLPLLIETAKAVTARTGQPVRLVIADTLSRVIGSGNESDAVDMNGLINNLAQLQQDTGATVMLIHHTGKDLSKGGRGSTALPGATDSELILKNGVIHAKKVRDAESGARFAFELKPVLIGRNSFGKDVWSCVAAPVNADFTKTAPKPGTVAALALQALCELRDDTEGELARSLWRPGVSGFSATRIIRRPRSRRGTARGLTRARRWLKVDGLRSMTRRKRRALKSSLNSHGDAVKSGLVPALIERGRTSRTVDPWVKKRSGSVLKRSGSVLMA